MSRLQFRFLMVMVPAFLLVAVIGFRLIANQSFGDEQGVLAARIGNLAARASSSLNKLPPETPTAQVQSMLSLLLADPAVSCAVVIDANKQPIAMAPPRIGCKAVTADAVVEVPINKTLGTTLCIKYNLLELQQRSALYRSFSYLTLIAAALVAALAGAFTLRLIVMRPITQLLKAIRQTQTTGVPVAVKLAPKDELGTVISAFNDMQAEINRKAIEAATSLAHVQQLYNETPAMMFCINSAGLIISASGHWLEHAGYEREDMLNQAAASFLKNSDEMAWKNICKSETAITDFAFTLQCKDGSQRDVLLNAMPDENATKLCVLSDITSLRAAEKELYRQAHTDSLTNLPNRKGLFDHLSKLHVAVGKHDAVLFIDLDNFKAVNDTLGHEAGDMLLTAAAGRLKNVIAKQDVLARLGGDEFAIILRNMANVDDAKIVADRIVAAFLPPFRLGEAKANVGTSIGIAPVIAGQSGEDILRLADLAMYEAKQSGKNCAAVYSSDMQARVIARDLMARRIRDALLEDQFEFYLQPILDIRTMRPVGAETLLRLNCAKEGMLSPAEIIQVAEETGLIKQITSLSMVNAASLHRELRSDGILSGYLTVNISAHQVNAEFLTDIVDLLDTNPDLAGKLVLEITETALFKNKDDASIILEKLRKQGCRIALDDFGTGYSSLAHLHRYPVDVIKLDRSFVANLSGNSEEAKRSRALIKATAAMAGELGADIVAEGIEDQETLELLLGFGVTHGQGYHFSRPLPKSAWLAWVDAFPTEERIQKRFSANKPGSISDTKISLAS